MNVITFFTNKKSAKDAAMDLLNQAASAKKPDLILFYATLKYHGKYQQMLDIFAKKFKGIPQMGASVDGMIFKDDMRTDGAALVFCYDRDARITVKSASEMSALKSAKKLAEQISCDEGVVILHFPLVHVPDVTGSIEFWARGRYYSFLAYRVNKRKYARQLADYCDRKKILYPAPTIIDIFAKKLGYRIPIIGVNLMHTGMSFNSPNVFANFEDINDGIAALVIEKSDISVAYDDIFPSKGKTLEETRRIVENHFTVVKKFKATFERNILVSLDGQPPIAAIQNLTGIIEENEGGIKSKLEDGRLQAQMPYILIYFNKKTRGIMTHAIGAYYPFDLFPFFFDTSDFSREVWLAYEPFYGKMKDFASSLYPFEGSCGFRFFVMDIGVVLAFEEQAIYYRDEIARIFKDNYFGLMTGVPSVYLPSKFVRKDSITEIKKNLFFSSCGSNLCVHII
jgi:hypothetical protein